MLYLFNMIKYNQLKPNFPPKETMLINITTECFGDYFHPPLIAPFDNASFSISSLVRFLVEELKLNE